MTFSTFFIDGDSGFCYTEYITDIGMNVSNIRKGERYE